MRYLLCVLCLFAAISCQEATAPGPPRGGEKILPVAETAFAVVVGHIDSPDKLDTHGYAAQLSVVRSLLATSPSSELRIAWEELAASRKPRFEEGDMILVALTPLPTASLWDQRFPGARGDASVLAVAAAGDAYMHNPDSPTLDLLEHYLRLSVDQREEAPGIEALAQIVASASPGVATSAVQRLPLIAALSSSPEASLRPLAGAMNDASRPPALRKAIVELIGAKKLKALRPQLDGLARRSSSLQATALVAVAAIDGGLPASRAAELLASEDAALRVLGARFAVGDDQERLVGLIKSDPSPEVRGAAAAALIRSRGLAGFADVVPALGDGNATARLAAVEAVGELGAAAVPQLTALARDGSQEEAIGAVLGLDHCGAEGRMALISLAADHPDERVRRVAQLALGKLGGHEH